MARSRRRLAAAAAMLLALAAGTAPASALRSLHVDALSMRADRARIAVGEVFHLAIHVRVRENVPALDELVIPDVGTMQIEGDERSVNSTASGTDVVETLTLEAMQAGAYTLPPAYLDAVDARTGKPSRFSSNSVRIVVSGTTAPALGASVRGVVRALVLAVALVCVAALAIVVAVLIARAASRRARTPSPFVAVAPPAAPPATARTTPDAVRDALATYRVAPSLPALMPLRAALFDAAGVTLGATLRDALASTADPALRRALDAAERTAFGPAFARDAASAELIGAVEAWLR